MQHLDLNVVHDMLETQDNILCSRGIKNFIVGLAMELLNSDDIPIQDFDEWFLYKKQNITTKEFQVVVSDAIWFDVRYTVAVDYHDDQAGYEISTLTIDKLTFHCINTEWNFTDEKYLTETIHDNLLVY